MANNIARRIGARARRVSSRVSDHSTPTPVPASRRSGTRGLRAISVLSDASPRPFTAIQATLPAHYTLPPTAPSPFTGTINASLDAILIWGSRYANTQTIVDTLLREVNTSTNWPHLLRAMYLTSNAPPGRVRYLLEELLFLVTRTLLPEQIAENRATMARLYDRKKHLAIRIVLRYDMLREWKIDAHHTHNKEGGVRDHAIAVASVAPDLNVAAPAPIAVKRANSFPHRRPLMPNIVPTLIAAPAGGFTTHGVRERMKHHVTDLDALLLLTDEKVAGCSDFVLVGLVSQIILQWQWLRQSNEILGDMEVGGWGDFDGKADNCEWVAEDARKGVGAGGRRAVDIVSKEESA